MLLKKLAGTVVLVILLCCSARAEASVADDYAAEAFGETGASWRMTSLKRLGDMTVVVIVPDRNIGIVAAELKIRPDGELFGVSVRYGSQGSSRPVIRVR